MKQTSKSLFTFVARADKIRRELVNMRHDLSEFIRHTDYILPKECLQALDDIEIYDIDDANNDMKWLVTHLASAMCLCEEGKEPPQEIEELPPDQC